jgi:hypothetical protein
MSMERYSFSTVVASLILNFIKLREQAKLWTNNSLTRWIKLYMRNL